MKTKPKTHAPPSAGPSAAADAARHPAQPDPGRGPARGPAGRPASSPVDLRLVAWMLFLTMVWGLNAVSIKVLTSGMAPLMAAGLRGGMALGLLTGFGALRGERMRYSGVELAHGLAVGGMFGLEFAFFYLGAPWTNGGHLAIFINTAPFWVALGAHFLLPGEPMAPLKGLGLLLAFAGIVVLFSDELYIQKAGFWRGDLMVLAGSALWGATTLYIKRFMVADFSGFRLLHVQVLVSTPLLLVLSLVFEPAPFFAVTRVTLANLLFQAVVVVFFSYLMWMILLRRYPAGGMQSFTFLSPVWGVLAGVVLLGEHLSPLLVAGIGCIGLGLYLVNRPPPKSPPKTPPQTAPKSYAKTTVP